MTIARSVSASSTCCGVGRVRRRVVRRSSDAVDRARLGCRRCAPSMRLPPFANVRVGAGHLERVDRLDAEPDREVAVERARDPEPVRHRGDVLRPDDRASAARRPCCPSTSSPSSGRSGRGTRPRSCGRTRAGRRAMIVTGFETKRRRRRDPLRRARREHERLERRARLPLALDGEVELALVEVVAADHREHGAVARVDRDERRRRARPGRQPLRRSPRARASGAEVDRRRHLQAAAEDLAARRTCRSSCCLT